MALTFDKAKPGAILRRKSIGSLRDCQLPDDNPRGSDSMKKFILQIVLIFFVFTSTTAVYSQVKKPNDDMYINSVGDFYLVDQHLVSNNNSTLIPVGEIRGVNDVYYVEYEYEVIVKDGMDLSIMIDDLFFTNELVSNEELRDTFQFNITEEVVQQLDYSEHMFGEQELANRVIVHVQVSMSNPETFELMQNLIGGQLSFEVYFFAISNS